MTKTHRKASRRSTESSVFVEMIAHLEDYRHGECELLPTSRELISQSNKWGADHTPGGPIFAYYPIFAT